MMVMLSLELVSVVVAFIPYRVLVVLHILCFSFGLVIPAIFVQTQKVLIPMLIDFDLMPIHRQD